MNGALRMSPVGEHAGDEGEIRHAMHDDAAEIRLAEAAGHIRIIEMQRIVVERGVAEVADGLARDGKGRAVDDVARRQSVEDPGHWYAHIGRMVQPRPEQMTAPCWLKKTLSCTTKSRSFRMNLSSARASRVIVSPGRAGRL